VLSFLHMLVLAAIDVVSLSLGWDHTLPLFYYINQFGWFPIKARIFPFCKHLLSWDVLSLRCSNHTKQAA
jgi:hypothetical protein